MTKLIPSTRAIRLHMRTDDGAGATSTLAEGWTYQSAERELLTMVQRVNGRADITGGRVLAGQSEPGRWWPMYFDHTTGETTRVEVMFEFVDPGHAEHVRQLDDMADAERALADQGIRF